MIRLVCLLAAIAASGCTGPEPDAVSAAPPESLRQAYGGAFLVGAALSERQFEDGLDDAIIAREFNSATPENVMKWEAIHPEPGVYDWSAADAFVEYAQANDLFIVGHTLVWHSQTPSWVFERADGTPLSRDELLERMEEHIATVVGRYRGRVGAWDVVNEALNEDGSLRDSPWLRIIGSDYLDHAFRFAHAADPGAELYYNDYSLENAPKRAGAIRIVADLRAAGRAVTGIGTQGHYGLTFPRPSQLDSTIQELSAWGPVMVSELDINVLPNSTDSQSADVGRREDARAELDPYTEGLPSEMQRRLADRYAELFEVMYRRRDQLSRVTFWGVTDGASWLNGWPIPGRTNYPLLFGRDGDPKPAYDAVLVIPGRTSSR